MHTEDTIAKTLSLLGEFKSLHVFMLFICKQTLLFSVGKFGKIQGQQAEPGECEDHGRSNDNNNKYTDHTF